MCLSVIALPECSGLSLFAGGSLDNLTPHAQPSRWCSCGSAGKANPGSGRSGGGPEPPEGGGDVQHRGREVEKEERSAGGLDGCLHHC